MYSRTHVVSALVALAFDVLSQHVFIGPIVPTNRNLQWELERINCQIYFSMLLITPFLAPLNRSPGHFHPSNIDQKCEFTLYINIKILVIH